MENSKPTNKKQHLKLLFPTDGKGTLTQSPELIVPNPGEASVPGTSIRFYTAPVTVSVLTLTQTHRRVLPHQKTVDEAAEPSHDDEDHEDTLTL